MWNDLPLAMRSAVQAHLPEAAFLRRDRCGGLFVSNAPAFGAKLPEIPDFRVESAGKLIRIYPDAIWLLRLEEGFSGTESDLSRSLLRFRNLTPTAEAMGFFCTGLKLLDAGEGASAGEIALFDRDVRQLAARVLRKDIGGGGLYGLSLLDAMLKK